MEVSSRRKTSSNGYRYSREHDYEFDAADISRASTPTSTFSSKSEGRKKEREHRYSVDDYKRKIARLKSELDLEKAKSKKAHKEKSTELRELQEAFDVRKQNEISELEHKLKKKLEKERRQLEENIRNSVREEKDKEVQDVLKYKDEEAREMRTKHKREKESAIKLALENEQLVIAEKERQMNDAMEKLKKANEKLEADYKKKCTDETRKEKEFTKIKEEYDAELRRILGESKKLALGNLEKLKKAEMALSENVGDSDDEMDFSDLVADLHSIHSQASSRAVSRSVSTTSELKFDEINMNINNLLASPAITPGPLMLDMANPSPLTIIKELQEVKSRSSSVMSEPAREMFSRKLDDKDRQLQKRVSELQTQTQRLERKIALIKTENETLKRKQDDKKPLEEKIKTLKKRNAELAAIARRLEEKAKHLQQENMKKTKELMGQQSQQPGGDQMKKMFARQRAKDLAEHAKNMLSKDREIEDLRKKCQELADQLSNADFLGPENSEMYEEKEELVFIIKQAAKERLQLERQLAVAKPGPDSKLVAAEKYKELEETNETLKKEIYKLERVLSDTERLEIELTQKKLECERLTRDIQDERLKSKTLESDLQESSSRNTELNTQVSSLQYRLADLDKVNEECSNLRVNLNDAQHECEVAKGEVSLLHLKVQGLETVVKNLEFSTEKLKQVEKDYHETVARLQDKQREIDTLQKVQESAREKYESAIKALQDKIKGLETQCQHQASKQQELTEELSILRAQANRKSSNETRTSSELQTGTSRSIEFAPSATSSPNQSPRHSPLNHNNNNTRRSPVISKSPGNSKPKSPAAIKSQSPSITPSLVKLHNSSKVKSPVQEVITQVTAKSVTQNTPKKVNNNNNINSNNNNNASGEQTESTKSGTDTGFADDDEVTRSNNLSPDPDKAEFEDPELFEIAKKLKELEDESDSSEEEFSKTDKGDDSGMESRGDQRAEREVSEMSVVDSRLSALGKKGPILVYIAKYSYDPYTYSPNENPEVELQIQSGDYVLIYGDMDEDGFFDGELIDGRRGLVPSNFIEKVADEDLPDFHAAMAMVGNHDEDSTAANSVHIDLDSSEDTENHDDLALNLPHQNAEPSSDLDDIEEEDEDMINSKLGLVTDHKYNGAPFPKNLQLDRQLANSILVSWQSPDDVNPADIRSYHVFLDGDFKTAIRGNERTKALLENVESRKIHRVSVRCVTSMGQSHDNQCTIIVGKDVIPAPFDLRVGDITANGATVTWTPGDSCLHHAIFVNNLEVRVLKPAVFSHTLTGLNPATCYNVKIQAKDLTGKKEGNTATPEQMSSKIEFMTALGGAPDPPLDVQVESGPQEGSILVTWLPVTIDTSGFSNGASVAGYTVYADGQKAKEAVGATNDHVILMSTDFHGFIPKELVLRTFTKDGTESVDSEIVRLPNTLIKEITVGAAKTIATDAAKKVRKSPLNALDTDEEIDSAFKEITQVYDQNTFVGRNFQEPFYDSSVSELSDIPEVDEVSSPEILTNENHPNKDTLHSLVNGLRLSNESSDIEEIYQRNLTEEIKQDEKSPRPLSSTPKKSRHSRNEDPISSPHRQTDKHERTPVDLHMSPKSVPQIEITRENSVDLMDSNENLSADKQLVKTDSNENNINSSKLTSQPLADNSSKYSANKDKRGGFRDHNSRSNSQSPHEQIEGQNRDINNSDIHRKTGSSPRDRDSRTPRDSSPKSANRGHGVSPRNSSRSVSPGANNARSRNSPRASPNPREMDRHGHHDNSHSHSPRDQNQHQHHRRKSSDTSPHQLSNNHRASPHSPQGHSHSPRDAHSHSVKPPRSPNPSPNPDSKSNHHKAHGYQGNNDSNVNDLSDLSSIDKVPSDINYQDSDMLEYDEGGDVDSISGEINPPIDDNRIRLFVALFDYDPEIMSPNVDALDEELPFREGQIIKVFGDKDPDGFYRGESGGRVGYIPCNMVSEIQVDDPELEEQLLREVQDNGTVGSSAVSSALSASEKYLKPITSNGVHLSPHGGGELAVRKMVALYDYDPQELSPNVDAEVELSFKVGDFIVTYGEMDDDGFYMGELNGRRGLVPSNFLQENGGTSDDEALDSVSVVTPARSGESINTSDSRKSEKSEKVDNKQQQPAQQKQSPNHTVTQSKHPTQQDQVDIDNADINMSRPRSMTPEELKQKKKSGGFLSKGKNILKKFTR